MKVGKNAVIHADREREIIAATKNLIISKGFASVTMKEISENISVTRQTLYKYYDSIDRLFFDVQLSILKEMQRIEPNFINDDVPPIKALSMYFNGYFEYAKEQPDEIAILFSFDFYNRRRQSEDELEKYYQANIGTFGYVRKVLERGILDGSIKNSIDINIAEATIINVAVGLVERFALIGFEKYSAEHNTGVDDVKDEFCAIIGNYLAN